jgi:hypothetical protein
MRHLLSRIYSGVPDARNGENAKEFVWLRFEGDKTEDSVKILIDESKGPCVVAR